ncbi:adenosine deaminase [Entamoeba marina]
MNSLDNFIHQFPKVELHTHLNGCIRENTLINWHSNKDVTKYINSFFSPDISSTESLSNCFKSFDLIYEATTSLDRIKQLVIEVLEDYDSDNAIIAEIRTTPQLLSILLKITFPNRSKTTPFYPYLLLSINRSRLNVAKDTINLAAQFKSTGFVKGIELSGNPFKGTYNEIVPLMNYAKEKGLFITMHIGEKVDDQEVMELLKCNPSRVGHGIYINKKGIEYMNTHNIDCEICLTSNIVSRSIPNYGGHPIMKKSTIPRQEKEYRHAVESYCKTAEESKDFIREMTRNGIEKSFLDENEKIELRHYISNLEL